MTPGLEANPATRRIIDALGRHVGRVMAFTLVETCMRGRSATTPLALQEMAALRRDLENGVRTYVREPAKQQLCLREIASVTTARDAMPDLPRLVKVEIKDETGMVVARGHARDMAASLGFSAAEQTQVATVVSELARNIMLYAGTGTVTLIAYPSGRASLQITAEDHGPGIADLDAVLSGARRSKTGMGLGLRGSRNLMDHLDIDTAPGRGTRIVATKYRR